MAVRLSSTLFRSRTSSGCASVTFLRSALALFASAVILSWLGHLWLGIVVIPFFKQRPWRIRSFGFLYSENSPNVKSRYVFHSGRADRRFELRRITQFECAKLLERFARGSSHLFKREQ